jgi:hypothetical protein
MNGNSSKIANVFAFCEYTTLQYKHKICTLSENIDFISTPVRKKVNSEEKSEFWEKEWILRKIEFWEKEWIQFFSEFTLFLRIQIHSFHIHSFHQNSLFSYSLFSSEFTLFIFTLFIRIHSFHMYSFHQNSPMNVLLQIKENIQ